MDMTSELLEDLGKCPDAMSALNVLRQQLNVHSTYHLAQMAAGKVDSPYVRTTYPPEWIAKYLLAGYVKSDPIAMAGFERILPFDWSEIEIPPSAMPLMRDAMEHGLGPSGYSVPIVDRHGRRALFSINGNQVGEEWEAFLNSNREALMEIAYIIHRLALKEIYDEDDTPQLTAREREVLIWTARGKDYRTIAQIIGVSHHTTKAYLKSARYKLDCVTLAQAVAKALSLRLISD